MPARSKKEKDLRPTKRQKVLLEYIRVFIAEHGYSPSYREIMNGLSYTSVATVALHINSLINRGHLIKRDNAARSLEVVTGVQLDEEGPGEVKEHEAKWLVRHVDEKFQFFDTQPSLQRSDLDRLYVLVGALKILGLEEAAHSFIPKLSVLETRVVG
jgi:SOS-response transcriptional repressor LexA